MQMFNQKILSAHMHQHESSTSERHSSFDSQLNESYSSVKQFFACLFMQFFVTYIYIFLKNITNKINNS